MEEISADEARRMLLWAQGMIGAADRRAGVDGLLRRLGVVQLDTISVLTRSHELVPYARLGAVGRSAVERAYWRRPPAAFEYWAHAACIVPIEDWPWMETRRRAYASTVPAPDKTTREVLARLADGPATATDLGGAKRGGVWWDWSDVKIAVERLLHAGVVACVERRGWKRVYDLAERVVPGALRAMQPRDEECAVELVRRSGRHLGVGTVADLADYYRQKLRPVRRALADSGLVPVRVRGWDEDAWADPGALDALRSGRIRGRHRTTLLSPFDPVVWDRARTDRIFGFSHRLEAYTPKHQRVHGYFVMPLLAGGRLVGRVDPARSGGTFVARQITLDGRAAVPAAAAALQEAAEWVGSTAVTVERVEPPELAAPLRAAVSSAG